MMIPIAVPRLSSVCITANDAITAIFAAIFYLGIGLTVLISPVPTTAVINCCNGCNQENCCGEGTTQGAVVVPECTLPSDKLAQQPGNSMVEKTENLDGTTTIKTTTFNPDGSQMSCFMEVVYIKQILSFCLLSGNSVT